MPWRKSRFLWEQIFRVDYICIECYDDLIFLILFENRILNFSCFYCIFCDHDFWIINSQGVLSSIFINNCHFVFYCKRLFFFLSFWVLVFQTKLISSSKRHTLVICSFKRLYLNLTLNLIFFLSQHWELAHFGGGRGFGSFYFKFCPKIISKVVSSFKLVLVLVLYFLL